MVNTIFGEKRMKRIVLTTESGTDLTRDHADRLGIRVIPMYVAMGDEIREDGSFPVTEVFDYYQRTRSVPTTSAVNPQEYVTCFRELRSQYPEGDIRCV